MTEEALLADLEKVTSDSILHDIARGIRGLNQGYDNQMGRAGEFLYGLQPATKYLIGADSGVGKSKFVNEFYVDRPWEYAYTTGKKIKIVNFSWEISENRQKLNLLTRLLNRTYGVRLPISYILSKGKYRCSQEHWQLCTTVEPQVELMFNDIITYDEPCHSKAYRRKLTKLAEQFGRFITNTVIDSEGNQHEEIIDYVASDPELLIVVVIDHLSLADQYPGMSLKQTMDDISKTGVYFRNRCKWTIVEIQQFNNDLQSTDRRKLDKSNIVPVRGDFGDSTYTFRDADVVWGLVSPAQFSFQEFRGYDVSKLGPSYIHAFLMKNRDGPPGMSYPFFMDAMVHNFHILPNLKFDLNGDINRRY
jgi:replicative DNA helicase